MAFEREVDLLVAHGVAVASVHQSRGDGHDVLAVVLASIIEAARSQADGVVSHLARKAHGAAAAVAAGGRGSDRSRGRGDAERGRGTGGLRCLLDLRGRLRSLLNLGGRWLRRLLDLGGGRGRSRGLLDRRSRRRGGLRSGRRRSGRRRRRRRGRCGLRRRGGFGGRDCRGSRRALEELTRSGGGVDDDSRGHVDVLGGSLGDPLGGPFSDDVALPNGSSAPASVVVTGMVVVAESKRLGQRRGGQGGDGENSRGSHDVLLFPFCGLTVESVCLGEEALLRECGDFLLLLLLLWFVRPSLAVIYRCCVIETVKTDKV